jgi:Polyketide cyclase / dehydrase and lipid transport
MLVKSSFNRSDGLVKRRKNLKTIAHWNSIHSKNEEYSMSKDSIHWPTECEPSRCPVHVVNSLDIAASPTIVWEQLIAATDWPTWYSKVSNVLIKGGSRKLSQGADFTWNTSGVTIVSTVKEFVPNERIAWNGKGTGLYSYHAWLITSTPSGCRVLSEETQRGILPRLSKLLMSKASSHWIQQWLEALATRSASQNDSDDTIHLRGAI